MNPRIVAISGPLQGSAFALGVGDLILGKGPKCNVRLNDPLVSPKHCGISYEAELPLIWDTSSETGTFVNGFYFHGKRLFYGDRIRVGHSVFVYLDRDDANVDSAMLNVTQAEQEWERRRNVSHTTTAYEPDMPTVLDALLEFSSRINGLRDAAEIQSCVFDQIFRLIPVEGAAILLSDGDGILSATYRPETFPIDDDVTEKALRDGTPVYSERVVCIPLVTPSARVGLLYAVMSAEGFEWFTGGHMRRLQAVAAQAAVSLDHTRYVAWLEGENRRLNEAVSVEHGMIGRSDKMQQVYQLVGRAGPSDLNVLITGESGTGKELVAKALHRCSARSQKAMDVVNCAAFTDTLLGSELFGHEKGAFTGADKMRKGLFESADGGTVFLDEIGECSLTLQADLLRLLQQREFKRLGGNQILRTDVRVVAATNVDLDKAIKEGRFRQDLYFRLNVIHIHLPRLAERREDIPLLAAELIKKHGHIRPSAYPRVQGISPKVRQAFASYDWPGNVRELENVIERAIALGAEPYISLDELPLLGAAPMSDPKVGSWTTELDAARKSIVVRAMRQTGGNRTEAADVLDLNLKYFSALCKELGVKG